MSESHGNMPLELQVGQQVCYASPGMAQVKTGVVVSAAGRYCGLTKQLRYQLRVYCSRYRQQELREIPASWIRRGLRLGSDQGNKE